MRNIKWNIGGPLLGCLVALVIFSTGCRKSPEISPAQSKSFIKFLGNSGTDEGNDVKQTSDGGYIIVGSKSANDLPFFSCTKTDQYGNTTWSNTYGIGVAYSVQIIAGGYVVLGKDGNKMKMLLLDEAGSETGSKTYGKGTSISSGNCVQSTSDGGFILIGSTDAASFSNPADIKDVYVVRTNSVGDTLWTNQYGGVEEDEGKFIQEKSDGSFILVGMTASFPPTSSSINMWVIEITQTGGNIGAIEINNSAIDVAESIEILSDGSYIILGTTKANGGDMLLVKLDQNISSTAWTKQFGSTGFDAGMSVKITNDGGFILSGTSTSADDGLTRMNLIKTDASGVEVWNKEYGGGTSSNTGNSVHQTSDGGYVSTGTTLLGENSMILFIKTDENGDLITD